MLEAITNLLGVLGTVLTARGDEDLGEYLSLAAVLVREGSDTREELTQLAGEIQALVDEGRNPTPEERERVRARRDELSDRMRSLGGQAEGDPVD